MNDIENNNPSDETQKVSVSAPFSYKGEGGYSTAVIFHFLYSFIGITAGIASLGGGVLLFVFGATGKVSWTAKFLGAESELADAAPGVILFIAGLFIIFITRFKLPSFNPADELHGIAKLISHSDEHTASIVKAALNRKPKELAEITTEQNGKNDC